MWTARTTVAQKEVRRGGGEPGGQGGNASIKGIFSKVADQHRKPVVRMLEHPPLLSTPRLS